MTEEIPYYGLRAYALFFSRHGTRQAFDQSELDWFVSPSMKKKIFALLLHAGWIEKISRNEYRCVAPKKVIRHLLDFKVHRIIQHATKPYAFTGLSAIEIWSDYVYMQRGMERSPYFIKIVKKDLKYWKEFFSTHRIPTYIKEGSAIGEFVILIPVDRVVCEEKNDFKVDSLRQTIKEAEANPMYSYPYEYMKRKFGGPI